MKVQDDPPGQIIMATGGLYAPTIRHRNGITYVICTNFIHNGEDSCLLKNFIVSTEDIWSDKWSDPVYIDYFGIDPDLFWDDDGKVFVMGSAWRDNPRAYISCMEIDIETGATLSPEVEVWEGFTKVIPEGPHVIKRDGYYYLLASEGGTSENHCLTMARSRCIWGPYESCERNPILRPANAEGMPVQHTGHGDLFQDAHGQWWAACLGVRKSQGRYHMGRESFLTRAHWAPDGWPVIEPVGQGAGAFRGAPGQQPLRSAGPLVDVVYLRDPDLESFLIKTDEQNIAVDIRPSQADLTDHHRPISFLGKRQRRLQGNASVKLLTSSHGPHPDGIAGLALYKDEHRFARIYWDAAVSAVKTEMLNDAKSLKSVDDFPMTAPQTSVTFRLEYTADDIRWYYRSDDKDEVCVGVVSTLDLTGYDFVGPLIGVFAVCGNEGKAGQEVARFREFRVDLP